jgi:energy-coupling factor transporter ATP-binding protein EcfA2
MIEFISASGHVIVVGFGGYLAWQGRMNVADIIGFLMYLNLFYQPITHLARVAEDVQTALAGAERVLQVLDAEPDVGDRPGAREIERVQGDIVFEHVDFSYAADISVLKDISFQAKPGQMVALVGPTGVGKTTMVSLLARFYEPTAGRILIDGNDIAELTLHALREQISIVLQDVFLFHGTVEENIAYGLEQTTHEDGVRAAQIARAHDFISELPQGYQTLVGERGIRLSGGQKQRLAIARAVLRDKPILILDEATALGRYGNRNRDPAGHTDPGRKPDDRGHRPSSLDCAPRGPDSGPGTGADRRKRQPRAAAGQARSLCAPLWRPSSRVRRFFAGPSVLTGTMRNNAIQSRWAVLMAILAAVLGLAAVPAAASSGLWPPLDAIQAEAYVVFDRSTGEFVIEHQADKISYPASTTKIMTALLALENLPPDLETTVSENAVALGSASSKVGLLAGEVVRVRDLIAGLLVASGNDAANVLAETLDGTYEQFASRMNLKAAELGLTNTHFCNPSGLHDDSHVTTARELALLADHAIATSSSVLWQALVGMSCRRPTCTRIRAGPAEQFQPAAPVRRKRFPVGVHRALHRGQDRQHLLCR